MSKGEFLTRLSIWITLGGYFFGVAFLLLSRRRPNLTSVARWVWTIACGCLCMHAICAYHFYHQWSQDSAYRRLGKEPVLLGSSGVAGLYFNYALIAGWIIDVTWWWRDTDLYRRRSGILTGIWQGFLWFMIFVGDYLPFVVSAEFLLPVLINQTQLESSRNCF